MNEDKTTLVTICRKISFSCGHRSFQPQFTEEQNREVYGSDYSEHGHGHNFVLEAYVEGQINADTGMVVNLRDLDLILVEVTKPLDHHHLNHDVPYFTEVVPTTENIAVFCFSEISKRLTSEHIRLKKVRLLQGPDLWVDCEEEPDVS